MQKPRADLDKLSIPKATAAAVPFVKPAERPAVSAPSANARWDSASPIKDAMVMALDELLKRAE
jgi:hypothetical protein